MAVSYKVDSEHLDLSRFVRPIAKISPEMIRSMESEITMSPTSHGYGENYIYTIKNGKVHLRFANRGVEVYTLKDVEKWGLPVVQAWEENDKSMQGWYNTANKNPPVKNEWIPRISDITEGKTDSLSYIVGIKPLRIWLPHENDTNVHLYSTPRIIEAADMNVTGRKVSELETFRQKIKSNLLFNDAYQLHYDIVKFAEILEKEGFPIIEKPILGLGVERGEFIAAYYPNLRYLVAENNFHERAKHLISQYGLTKREAVEAMERMVLLHELAHAYGIKSERLEGLLQAKFGREVASELHGTKWQRVYEALAQIGSDRARDYSLLNNIWREIVKDPSAHQIENIEILIRKFELEGKAEGKEGDDLISYVKERRDNTYQGIGQAGPPVENKSRVDYSLKSKNQKSLDGILFEAFWQEATAKGLKGEAKKEYVSGRMQEYKQNARRNTRNEKESKSDESENGASKEPNEATDAKEAETSESKEANTEATAASE